MGSLDDLLNPPGWHRDALCREPLYRSLPWVRDVPPRGARAAQMASICGRCLVRRECLSAGLRDDEVGLWGGLSQTERRLLARRKDAA